MKKMLFLGILLLTLMIPAHATGIVAPEVPDDATAVFPDQQEDFGSGVWYMITQAFQQERAVFRSSVKLCFSVIGTTLILSLIRSFAGKSKAVVEMVGVLAVTGIMVGGADSMIEMGTQTVWQISQYGKLLLPVMTAALASQGGAVSAASLYGATALFDTLLCSVISAVLVPMVYVFLVLSIINALSEDGMLKKLKELCKWAMGWFFKIILYVFTGYITITGVISGTADQAAVKATKLTISGVIPVVGGILSDASETILVSAGMVKNAAGIYGMLAILAVTIAPFLAIGVHYLLLKVTAAVSGVFAPPNVSNLLEDFSSCMGLVLAMVGSVCLMQLISVVCFLKGMT